MIKKNIFIAPVRLELIFLQFEASELTKLLNLFLKRDLTFSHRISEGTKQKPMLVGKMSSPPT